MAPQEHPQSDAETPHPASAMTLHEAITTRHASREFLPDPVPAAQLHRALALAAHAPSNSNVQPWRLWLLSGAPLAALGAQLTARASSDEAPCIPPLPAWASPCRSRLGALVFGEGWGVARDDADGQRAAVLRNFAFFGAPLAGVVCMRDDLAEADALSVGMYLQTLALALRSEGLATCVQVSIAGYPDVVRKAAGIPADMVVICGIAIGFEDPKAKVNTVRPVKMTWEETTVVLSD